MESARPQLDESDIEKSHQQLQAAAVPSFIVSGSPDRKVIVVQSNTASRADLPQRSRRRSTAALDNI